ncbi:hypothetical protein GWI33_006632 [Rhynchophorus ferrugineus]|uniref:Uncharacterized protein n=1 Tax=Rhynchophorus ferrugineus TaxID=354439 RepID=A0A834MFB4_RHYFE|nr:hypothetical protein GWI33_006632 [Rhynchophorus ferrugineus]
MTFNFSQMHRPRAVQTPGPVSLFMTGTGGEFASETWVIAWSLCVPSHSPASKTNPQDPSKPADGRHGERFLRVYGPLQTTTTTIIKFD